MLFNEVYGAYYNAVAAILSEAVKGEVTDKRIYEIVRDKAFSESVLTIPAALKDGAWPLIAKDGSTPIKHEPKMPLTELQRCWLKALLSDPRIKLFVIDETGLEDVEPLYKPDVFVYFDRYSDGDDFDDPRYIENFRTILTALREKRKLKIKFKSSRDIEKKWVCVPCRLEYSSKDDKFRLLTFSPKSALTINLGRIKSVKLLEPYSEEEYKPIEYRKERLVLEVKNERNALERALLSFSHFEKEAEKLDDNRYRLTLFYERDDETELVIRVLSFGPVLRVVEPDFFRAQVYERIKKQQSLRG